MPPLKWLTILFTGLVSLVVGVGSALIIDYVHTSASKLEYEVISSASFSGQIQKVGLVAIEVQNSGKHELEFVSARIQMPGAIISDSRTEGFPTKGLTESRTNDTYVAEVPFLNPAERGRILLFVNLGNTAGVAPIVELRAKGVTGKQRSNDRKFSFATFLAPVFLTIVSVFVTFDILRRRSRSGTHHGGDDQRDVVAFILDIHGLSKEGRALRSQPRKLTYWGISDELTQDALLKNEPDYTRKVTIALNTLLESGHIADSSKAIITYNLARLYYRIGDVEKAKTVLISASKLDSNIDKRIEITEELKPIAPEPSRKSLLALKDET